MFLIDWIYDYMNTPALDMTAEIQALYYAALMIIGAGAVAMQQLKGLSVEKLAAILLIISAYLIIMSVRDIIKRIKRGKKNEK